MKRNRAYFDLVAKENCHARELLALADLAVQYKLATQTVNNALLQTVQHWELNHPRLSALYRERTGC